MQTWRAIFVFSQMSCLFLISLSSVSIVLHVALTLWNDEDEELIKRALTHSTPYDLITLNHTHISHQCFCSLGSFLWSDTRVRLFF